MIDESHLLSHSSKTTTSSPTMISSTKTKREVIVIAHVVSIVVCAKYLTSKKLQLIWKKKPEVSFFIQLNGKMESRWKAIIRIHRKYVYQFCIINWMKYMLDLISCTLMLSNQLNLYSIHYFCKYVHVIHISKICLVSSNKSRQFRIW